MKTFCFQNRNLNGFNDHFVWMNQKSRKTRNKRDTNDETMIREMHTKRLWLTNIKHMKVENKVFCKIAKAIEYLNSLSSFEWNVVLKFSLLSFWIYLVCYYMYYVAQIVSIILVSLMF